MTDASGSPSALAGFVAGMDAVLAAGPPPGQAMHAARTLMQALVARDDWLDPAFAAPHPTYYQQYLLHLDAQGRYSVVSFVWGPGQATPVHDHGTWGVIGMLRGAECSQGYVLTPQGVAPHGEEERLLPGDTALVSPEVGDIHRVRNAFDDRVSISIHAYGTDIGRQRRHVYDLASGAAKPFVSGYANADRAGAP